MRCTAPIKAPSPPPTIPSRSRRVTPMSVLQAHQRADLMQIGAAAGKIVKRPLGHTDDVAADEVRAFARAVLGMLEGAFPFEHRPARVVVLRHLGEDRLEVDLPIAQRAEAAGPLLPALVAAVHALPPVGTELGILDVEGLDA